MFTARVSCVLVAALLGAAPSIHAQERKKPAGKPAAKPQDPAGKSDSKDKAKEGEFPRDWFYDNDQQWARHFELVGKPMPKLDLSEWANGKVDLQKDLKGKVVVVDFWATWCGPCLRSIPHNNELFEKHGKDGLVLVGVCGSDHGQEKMKDVVAQKEIKYPVARDASEKSAKEWHVMYWPTYGVIDRTGKLRALGLKPDRVGAVVEKLLAEKADGAAADPAGEKGKSKDPKGEGDGKESKPPKDGEKGTGAGRG